MRAGKIEIILMVSLVLFQSVNSDFTEGKYNSLIFEVIIIFLEIMYNISEKKDKSIECRLIFENSTFQKIIKPMTFLHKFSIIHILFLYNNVFFIFIAVRGKRYSKIKSDFK